VLTIWAPVQPDGVNARAMTFRVGRVSTRSLPAAADIRTIDIGGWPPMQMPILLMCVRRRGDRIEPLPFRCRAMVLRWF
jgi:hypothetical protein